MQVLPYYATNSDTMGLFNNISVMLDDNTTSRTHTHVYWTVENPTRTHADTSEHGNLPDPESNPQRSCCANHRTIKDPQK